MTEQTAFEKHTTVKTSKDGMTAVSCNKGLWSVSSHNKNKALAAGLRYFMQYAADGEYDIEEEAVAMKAYSLKDIEQEIPNKSTRGI